MDKEQFELAKEGILEFCYLVTDKEYRDSPEYLDLYKDLIKEEVDETQGATSHTLLLDGWCDSIVVLVQALESPLATPDEVFKWNNRISYTITQASETMAGFPMYDLYGALMEVNRNNLSKVPLLSEVKDWYGDHGWERSSCEWIESQGRYKGVHCSLVDGGNRVVFKDENGKVVKWAGYVDVDLSPYVRTGSVTLPDELYKQLASHGGPVTIPSELAIKLGIGPAKTEEG